MSFGNWLHKPAVTRSIGVGIALIGALLIGWALWPAPPALGPHHHLEPFNEFFASIDGECSAILARRNESQVLPKEVEDCAEKETMQKKGYRDLAEAVRAANAAEDSAWLSYLQTRASIVGAVLILLTLSSTAWAAWAAWAAADAARIAKDSVAAAVKANELAKQAFIADQRAWLTTTLRVEGDFSSTNFGAAVAVSVRISNIGKTPALEAPYQYQDDPRSHKCAAGRQESLR